MLEVIEINDFKDLKYFGKITIPANHVVYTLMGPISSSPTRTSIQIGKNKHVEDVLGQYVNHSCNPTTKVVNSQLIALRDLEYGDSITFDYNTNEDHMSNPFYCNCCNKLITGRNF